MNIEHMQTVETIDQEQKWQHMKNKGIGIQDIKYNIVKKCHPYLAGGDKCNAKKKL